MYKLIQKDETKLKSFWTSIGGDYTALKKSIEVGYNKKAIGNMFSVGLAPQALAATATPIIIKVNAILKSAGIDIKDLAKFAADKVKQVASDKLEQVVEKAAEKIEAAVTPKEKAEAVEQATAEVAKETAKEAADTEAKEVETIMPSNTNWLLIGGGIAAVVLLPKLLKRK